MSAAVLATLVMLGGLVVLVAAAVLAPLLMDRMGRILDRLADAAPRVAIGLFVACIVLSVAAAAVMVWLDLYRFFGGSA